jgi:hypothetical protein
MMAQYNNPNAADGRKPLVLSLRLSAAADWERWAALGYRWGGSLKIVYECSAPSHCEVICRTGILRVLVE